MKLVVFIVILVSMLFSCAQNEVADLKKQITQKEEFLAQKSRSLKPGESMTAEDRNGLVDLLIAFYEKYPTDEFSPACLEKLHMIYSSEGDHLKAVTYGEMILEEYKTYVNRPMILESVASTYDVFLQPRDASKVAYYYKMLLEEDKEMSKEKRADVEFRLKHIDKPIEEIILMK